MDSEEDQNIEWLTWDAGISDISIRTDNGEILMADWFDGTIRRLEGGASTRPASFTEKAIRNRLVPRPENAYAQRRADPL